MNAFPQWILIGITGLTAVFIMWQAWETRRAANKTAQSVREIHRQTEVLERSVAASEKTAEAAASSAAGQLGADRAWVLERINFPDKLPVQGPGDAIVAYVSFTFRNRGRTPARITNLKLHFHTLTLPTRLPESPDYGISSFPELGTYGMVLGANEKLTVGCFLEDRPSFEDADRSTIASGQMGVFAYGLVEYETLGSARYTRFCYVWHEPGYGFITSADVPGFRKGGPHEYNRAT